MITKYFRTRIIYLLYLKYSFFISFFGAFFHRRLSSTIDSGSLQTKVGLFKPTERFVPIVYWLVINNCHSLSPSGSVLVSNRQFPGSGFSWLFIWVIRRMLENIDHICLLVSFEHCNNPVILIHLNIVIFLYLDTVFGINRQKQNRLQKTTF